MSTTYCYGRVSTSRQVDNMTRKDQESACLQYYKTNLSDTEYGGFYFDDAESGGKAFAERKVGRTLYHSLLQPGDSLVCYEADRLTRDTDDWVPIRKDFANRNIGLLFVHDPFASVTRQSVRKFGRDLLVAAATLLREEMSENKKQRNKEKRERGDPVSHCAAIGWKIVGEGMNRRYRIDENERRIVDIMASLRREGLTHAKIGLYISRPKVARQLRPKRFRTFSTDKHVRWALRARLLGYPKDITSREEFERQWRKGLKSTVSHLQS